MYTTSTSSSLLAQYPFFPNHSNYRNRRRNLFTLKPSKNSLLKIPLKIQCVSKRDPLVTHDNPLKLIVKPIVYTLFSVALGCCPLLGFQFPAPALALSPAVAHKTSKNDSTHPYSRYTKALLQTVSRLLQVIEEVKSGKQDVKCVEAKLNDVKMKREQLQAKIMKAFAAELILLNGEKSTLDERCMEIVEGISMAKSKGEGLLKKKASKGKQDATKGKLVDLDEELKQNEEEYNRLSERIEEIDDEINRRETLALGIGVRELLSIEKECQMLVHQFLKKMKQQVKSVSKSSFTKLSRSEIKKELETAQRHLLEQVVLPSVLDSVLENEDSMPLFDQDSVVFAQRIQEALKDSREMQQSLESRIKRKMKRYGDEKRFVVNTPVDEVVKGFPEIELKWMFGNKEVVVPKAVSLHLYHGWKKWRKEVKADLKRDLLENVEYGRKYLAEKQEMILLHRDRVVAKSWYNEEKNRWEMDPVAVPYAVSKKLLESARIRHDWAAMYVMLKGDDKEYYVDIKEYDTIFEDFGGFDALYMKLLASDIPTVIQLMWIPFLEMGFRQQFFLVTRFFQQCLNRLWTLRIVSRGRNLLVEKLRDLGDDIMIMIVLPIVEFVVPYQVRMWLGMAWPEYVDESVGSTWFVKWQSDAEQSFELRKSDSFLWYLWFLIRIAMCGYVGYVVYNVIRFMKRKILPLLGYGPSWKNPYILKLNSMKAYFKVRRLIGYRKRKARVDPISTAFDQMKRVKNPPIRLKDFASIESMKEEINEVVAFLKNPRAFQEMGARAPRGVLLVGEIGTGKTSLALAIAAEAKVPLVEVKAKQLETGSLVGQSASNVREMFQIARDLAPVIIFVEDLDLFIGVRGKHIHTKQQDHEALINQLLVELDGFEKQDGVVLMATARYLKHIDKALRRPGRMDRIFRLQRPTQAEREKILKVAAKETLDEELIDFIDWTKVAEKTALMHPRELKLVPVTLECSAFRRKVLDKNELMTYCSWFATFSSLVPDWLRKTKAVKQLSRVLVNHLGLTLTKEDLENVVDLMEPYGQISSGIELLNPPIDWTTKTKFPHAVWASGRSLIALLLPNFDIVDNLWLEPFSWEGIGCTKITKAKTEGSVSGNVESRSYLEKRLVFCFGSYVAAQLLLPFGEENMLSSSELKQAQEIAARMVIQYGWGPDDSPTIYHHRKSATTLSMGDHFEYEMAAKVEKMYYMAYDKAKEMLQTNRLVLEKIVDELLKFEILTGKDLERILADNDGVREKEPFFLSKAYNEPVLEKLLEENGEASSRAFLTATN